MGFFVSVGFLIFVVFGGSYTFWGPLFGGMALTILPELLRFSAKDRFIIYGALLTVMVIIRPQGLITRVPTGAAPRWFGGRQPPCDNGACHEAPDSAAGRDKSSR